MLSADTETRDKPETLPVSESDDWATPAAVYRAALRLWGPFTLDAAASVANKKCRRFFTLEDDALSKPWSGRVWLNPPYSRGNLERFMSKARGEVLAGRAELVACLVPGHTAEGWWHRHVEYAQGTLLGAGSEVGGLGGRTQYRYADLTTEVVRVRGRVRFVEASGKTGAARFPSVFVVHAQPGVLAELQVSQARRRGPRSSITEQQEAYVRAAIARGCTVTEACQVGGVSRAAWYRKERRP